MIRIAKVASTFSMVILSYLPVYAQNNEINVTRVQPQTEDWKSVSVGILGDQEIGIKKIEDNYFFTPTPVVDWIGFSESVERACSGANNNDVAVSELFIQFYNPHIFAEIAQKAQIDLSNLAVVPHFGTSLFLQDVDQVNHLVRTDVDLNTLNLGESLSASRPLPPSQRILIKKSCGLMRELSLVRVLTASYHVQGQKFQRSSISAEVLLSQTVDTFFDTSDSQSETETTTVNVSTGGSGIAIDLGPISWNNSGGSITTTSSSERFRAVNRQWVSNRAESTLLDVSIEEICDGRDNCVDASLRETIVNFVLRGAENQRVQLSARSDGMFDVLVGQTNVGPAVLKIDDSVEGTLNTIFANSREEEQSAKYSGFEGTFKKKDDNTLTLNGNTEFTRNGEDWVPTSLTLDLVDTSRIVDRVRTGYAKTVLNDLARVSFRAQNAPVEGLPENFIKDGFFDQLQNTLAELSAARTHIAGEPQRRLQVYATPFIVVTGEGANGQLLYSNGDVHRFDKAHLKLEKCPQHGGRHVDQAYANGLCGSANTAFLSHVMSHGGRTCGYNIFLISCVNNK